APVIEEARASGALDLVAPDVSLRLVPRKGADRRRAHRRTPAPPPLPRLRIRGEGPRARDRGTARGSIAELPGRSGRGADASLPERRAPRRARGDGRLGGDALRAPPAPDRRAESPLRHGCE